MYANPDLSGDDIWKYMDSKRDLFDKKRLKEALVKEQGFICCYCGRRIFVDHNTHIEHLLPKHAYKNKTYDYKNLFASCQGGTKDEFYVVEKQELLEDIALRFGLNQNFLEEVFVDYDNQEMLRKLPDLESVSIGDRVLIYRKVSEKESHCGHRKNKAEIDISPSQKDCESHFFYDKRNGKIKKRETNTHTIDVLGLNDNKYLNLNRLRQIEQAITKLKILIEQVAIQDRNEFIEKRNLLIQQLNGKDAEGKHRPWHFVEISVLKGN
ncbi:MAG: retron system putative HNH endonuclease [Bacteroidota bacterium]